MRLHSRLGSIVLGLVGSVYTIAALWLLVRTVPETWGFAGLRDYVLFLALCGAAIAGVWFVSVSMTSLDIHVRRPPRRV